MAALRDDLTAIADYLDTSPGDLKALPEALPEGLEKIDWKRLTCFILPIANVFLAAKGFPPLPIPAFCTTPADPLA
jgi:hypothetical protein